MRVRVGVKEFLALLRTMKPKAAAAKGLRSNPEVRITAGGSTMVLIGDFENSASAPAEVIEPGSGVIPLTSTIRLLTTYPKKAIVELKAEPGVLWLDKLKLTTSTI